MRISAKTIEEFQRVESIVKTFPESVSERITIAREHSTDIFFFEIEGRLGAGSKDFKVFGDILKVDLAPDDSIQVWCRSGSNSLYFEFKKPKSGGFTVVN